MRPFSSFLRPDQRPTDSPERHPMPAAARDLARRLGLLALLATLSLAGLACAGGSPPGKPFMEAAPPGPSMARLYIYRVDAVSSGGSRVSLRLGDQDLGRLRNHEYLTVLVPPGRTVLSARYLSLLSGTLTGTLADGSPLTAEFGRAVTGTIQLVPEPSAAALLVLGLVGMALRRAVELRGCV